ncbi:hypothetical protein C1893_09635 [Pseudomonas sp. MPR-ANC1]|uniref:hypothetical protein n=1 Tax=Pseudomonas sp. MPR-ANC1 TaxID=2075548 RepID=UPI000CD04226|nr:hypothetical protein [Pseudomonas sp. MPR-ANC1]POA48581.1 hypothetical protein C1893_09635 [Pseudomonas sp. MPR-ANC1]
MRNKPKAPRLTPEADTATLSTSRPVTPDKGLEHLDFNLPGRKRPGGANPLSSEGAVEGSSGRTVHPEPAVTVSVTPLSDTAPAAHTAPVSPLQPYVQKPGRELSAPDAAGLRSYKGRQFAEVAGDHAESGTQTVMVMFDEVMKAWRAKLPSERNPSGPPLYRIANGNTWSLKKPVEYYDHLDYSIHHLPDSQGYYGVSRRDFFNANRWLPTDLWAFRDSRNGNWVKVVRVTALGDSSATPLAHWTDGEIWSAYRLHGAEAQVFRTEAQSLGRAPDWARRFDEPDVSRYLTDSLKWLHPHKSLSERSDLLRSYNLTAAQQTRLRQDLKNGPFPEWAEQHKQLTQSNDEQRFKHIAEELDPYCLRLRNEGENFSDSLPDVDKRYDRQFLESYLQQAGYKRNVHDSLYRTDIPGMFRADLRTPFELARDKRLVKLRGNPSDTTTKRALSATFGLANALSYMSFDYYSNPRHYNSQANRYPGHFSDSDSSTGNRHSTDGESDTSFEMDDSRDYPLLRRNQKLGFLYVIDTRGVEVVPRVENIYLNNMDFDGDTLEGRISMPTRGISAERIWLVHSDLKRAARVEDIFRQAGDDAEEIESATWAGVDADSVERVGHTPYDALINQVADSGGEILDLPKGNGTFANDIVWSVPEHHRT